jgi:hypothetical protein
MVLFLRASDPSPNTQLPEGCLGLFLDYFWLVLVRCHNCETGCWVVPTSPPVSNPRENELLTLWCLKSALLLKFTFFNLDKFSLGCRQGWFPMSQLDAFGIWNLSSRLANLFSCETLSQLIISIKTAQNIVSWSETWFRAQTPHCNRGSLFVGANWNTDRPPKLKKTVPILCCISDLSWTNNMTFCSKLQHLPLKNEPKFLT